LGLKLVNSITWGLNFPTVLYSRLLLKDARFNGLVSYSYGFHKIWYEYAYKVVYSYSFSDCLDTFPSNFALINKTFLANLQLIVVTKSNLGNSTIKFGVNKLIGKICK